MLLIFLTCLLSSIILAEPQNATVGNFVKNQIQLINIASSEIVPQNEIISLISLQTSIVCNKTNTDNIKIVKNKEGLLFLLSVDELLAIEINQQKIASMQFIGTLLQLNETIQDIQIERWQNAIVIVVRLSSSLHVYMARNNFSIPESFEPIQKIKTLSDRFVLFNDHNDLLMVIYDVKESSSNELTFYKWRASFFSKESKELVDIPNKSNLFLVNEGTDSPLLLSIGYGNKTQSTRVAVFKHVIETNRWTKMQSMHFKKNYIEYYVADGNLYLIGCSTHSFCAIYKWIDSEFHRHHKLNSDAFEKIKSIYSRNNITIIENFQNQLEFHSSESVIVTKPGMIRTKKASMVDYAIHKSHHNETFYVEFIFNKISLTVDFYEISIEKVHAIEDRSVSNNPLSLVSQIKSVLKSRLSVVKSSQDHASKLKASPSKILQMESKKTLKAKSVNLKATKIKRVKLPYTLRTTPRQIGSRTVNVNIQVELARKNLRNAKRPSLRLQEREDLDSVDVKNLVYNGNQLLFKDLLLKSSPAYTFAQQKRLDKVTTSKLTVQSNKINKIQLEDILRSTVKHVKGLKIFKNLKVNQLIVTDMLNGIPVSVFDTKNKPIDVAESLEFQGDINVKHLKVKTLNDFNVPLLFESVFLKGERKTIKGNLVLQNITRINQLSAKSLMDLPADHLMTLSTDQVIIADVFINKFNSQNITTGTINEEQLSRNVALINSENIIEVPTKFMSINILQNLNIEDESDDTNAREGLSKTIDTIKRHIIGTKTSDLSQIYSGKVTIKGSLTIKNAKTFSSKTRIFLNDAEVPLNISSTFWMKSLKQDIQVENFRVESEEMEVSSILTNFLDAHPVRDFLLLDTDKPQGSVNLMIANSIVDGDVKGHKENVPSLLYHLNKTAVHRQGPPIVIESSVDFRGKLSVKNLKTEIINEHLISEMVHKNSPLIMFQAPKKIRNLQVKSMRVEDHLNVTRYNDVNLEAFQDQTIRIDQPITLESLTVSSFDANNLTIEEFEGHEFNRLINNLEQEFQFNSDGSKTSRNVRINGNVDFQSNIFIETINGIQSFNDYAMIIASKNDANQLIGGKKVFKESVNVQDYLEVKTINGFSANRLLYQSLSRGERQTISGNWTVNKLITSALMTYNLNDIKKNQFVSRELCHLPLMVNVDIDELEVNDITAGSSPFDITRMLQAIHFPKRVNWDYITTLGYVSMPTGEDSVLDHLMKFGVYRKGFPQIITGSVTVVNDKLYLRKIIKMDSALVANGSPIDIQYLHDDSVKNETGKVQVVRGIKSFLAPAVYVSYLRIDPRATFDTSVINDVNVLHLNNTIIRPTDYINNEKRFENIYVDDLIVHGRINGIEPDNLIALPHDKIVRIPEITFKSLQVMELTTFTFNLTSVLWFLGNRMRKHSTEGEIQNMVMPLNFVTLELQNETVIPAINDLMIDDAVFSYSDQLQEIYGHKIVTGTIKLIGPAIIGRINGIDFMDFTRHSVMQYENHQSKLLVLPAIELKQGIQIDHSINNHRIEDLLTSDAHVPKLNVLTSLMEQVQIHYQSLSAERKLKKSRAKRLLYIDYDPNVEIRHDGRRINDRCAVDVIEPSYNQIVVKQKRNSEFSADVASARLKLTPDFRCHQNSLSSKSFSLTWMLKSIPDLTYFQNFTFTNEISDVKFLESTDHLMMILTMENQKNYSSEVVILKLDKMNHEWYENQKIPGLKAVTKSSIVETSNYHFLVISSFDTNADNDFVMIRILDTAGQFTETQRKLPGAKYDIVLSADVQLKFRAVKSRTFLIMSRVNSKFIIIYRFREESLEFILQRKILFESEILEVVVMYINDAPFFIVSLQTGDFCVYEYRGIESWQAKQCGYFANINHVKSYEFLKRQHLFLISTLNSGTALTVYKQGELY